MITSISFRPASRAATGTFRMNCWLWLLLTLFLFPAVSCRKTDKLAEQVNNQPFLITTDFGLVPWHLPNYSYQRSYLVGCGHLSR